MNTSHSDPAPLRGEVAGSFLLGLLGSFHNLANLPKAGLSIDQGKLDPVAWYPYSMFMEVLDAVEKAMPSASVFFQAGVNFLRIWYEHGPGKEMIHSSVDWLNANSDSQGYNSVVRGGTPAEVGWCRLLSLDLEKGLAIHENVMPLPADYVKGVFYGGCRIFDDLDFVEVDVIRTPCELGGRFQRFLIATKFRLKDPEVGPELDRKLAAWTGEPIEFTAAESTTLAWRFKGLSVRNNIENAYQRDINGILAESFVESQRNAEASRVAKEAAERANLAKTRFLATMSHEIRTPLNGILSMAQYMMESELEGNEQKEASSIILNSGRSLLTLLNDILDLSRIESGAFELERQPVEPGPLAKEVARLFHEQARAKGLIIEVVDSTYDVYLIDPLRLRQMLTNYVNNAIKFTMHGGVTISIREVSRQDLVARLEIAVEDTGVGVATDAMDRLFKPFSQADMSTTRQFGGSGLGLSIVRNLATLMGGDVGVSSQSGKGSRFWFQIQAQVEPKRPREEASNVIVEQESKWPSLRDRLVWLVEDNVTNQRVGSLLLGKIGVRYEVIENGKDAYDRIQSGLRPDLILMDGQMPIMDGREATIHIRQWETKQHRPRTPIVALTANSFQEDRQACLDVGMDDFLSKPIDIRKLRSVLMQWLASGT